MIEPRTGNRLDDADRVDHSCARVLKLEQTCRTEQWDSLLDRSHCQIGTPTNAMAPTNDGAEALILLWISSLGWWPTYRIVVQSPTSLV